MKTAILLNETGIPEWMDQKMNKREDKDGEKREREQRVNRV